MADERTREERVAAYRERSREADELANRGRKDEALALLRTCERWAAAAGDEDYRLFLESEIATYAEEDRVRTLATMLDALRWAEGHATVPDAFLYRQLGVHYSQAGDLDAAVEWYDKALAENPHDGDTMRARGVSLSKRDDEDAAIEWFDRALAENPRDWNAMRQKGVSLSYKGDQDAAIEWFDMALAENPHDGGAMCSRGAALSKRGDQDAAIEWFDRALAENPHDVYAMRNRGGALSKRGDQDGAIDWLDRALAENPHDGDAMRNRGAALSNKGDQDGAIEWCDRALAENPHDGDAMCNRGIALSKKGDEGAAIEWFDKALTENPHDGYAMCQRGFSLSRKGDQDAAIEWYDRALVRNPHDGYAMRCRGAALCKKGDHAAAIEWFEKALAENSCDAFTLRCSSASAFVMGDADTAFARISEAARLDPELCGLDFLFVCSAFGSDPDEEWRRVFSDRLNPPPRPTDTMRELAGFVMGIRGAYHETAEEFLRQKREAEGAKREFLAPESRLDPNRSVLLLLRRWNSYTPAVPSADEDRSRGGGYFLWHGGRGTVIDPGYGFLANLARAGGRICDVDNIILTHAHGDHTADFESLCTLLHEYNDQDDGRPTKRVRVLLNNGSMVKFSGMLPLRGADYIDRVHTLNPGWECDLGEGLRLQVLSAYHDEVISRDQSVGLLFMAAIPDGQRTILFTGDTGLLPLERDAPRPTPQEHGKQIWETYPQQDGVPVHPDLMVVHIGSIKETELEWDQAQTLAAACYPNHLGIIGTARLITSCRPHLAVVSEFGEEMERFRSDLVRGLQENVVDRWFARNPEPHIPRVVPGDLPFIYDIASEAVYDCASRDWVAAQDMQFDEAMGGEQKVAFVYYFGDASRFRARTWEHIDSYWECLKNSHGLYFKPQETP